MFKFKTNNILIIKSLIYLYCALYFFFVNAQATEQKFQYHGFIAQGLIGVDGSDFVNDNGDGHLSSKLTEIGINASYQLNSNFRLTGQFVYLNGGNRYVEGVRLDYAIVDWSVYKSQNLQANIFMGRFKNNHWLYSSSRDIPFARPSIILPQSVYFDGFRDIAVGADGAAIKISSSDDVYGNFDFNLSYGTSPISNKQGDLILSEYAQGTVAQDSDLQASLYWQPAFSLWRFGVSYLDSVFNYESNKRFDKFFDGDFSFKFYTINALFEGEKLELSGEIYQEQFITEGFYQPLYTNSPTGQGIYVQSRYKINQDLTLLARYENFYSDRDDKNGTKLEQESEGGIPAYFAYNKDTTIGLTYDFSSNLRLRLEHHWFQGTGRLTPVVLPNPAMNHNKNWQLWAMQLMYWF